MPEPVRIIPLGGLGEVGKNMTAFEYGGRMILVDAGEDNPLRMLPNGQVVRASEMGASKPIPPVNTSTPLRESDIPAAAFNQMQAGARASVADANSGPHPPGSMNAARNGTPSERSWR